MTSVGGQKANLIGQSLGVYRLDALLGAGGMAEVYRALDTKLQREVAVKVLPATLALDPNYVERFRSEGRQVAALNHPHIVPVYQYGEENGLLYLVMPVLKESLRDRLDREHHLSPSEATRLAVQIAAALDAAHARGLVHRDVKPENILLNDEGRALLTDFGIAREVAFLRETGSARTLAASGLPVGTPEYMAPEQLRGLPVDQRADVYALGAVLYELLTGLVPHDAATPYEVAALVLTAPTAAPSVHNPQIWPELDAVVLRSLAKTPEDRFQDARSFALALRQVVVERGRPTAAAIPSVRWTRFPPPAGPVGAEPPMAPGASWFTPEPQPDPTEYQMTQPLIGGIGGFGAPTGGALGAMTTPTVATWGGVGGGVGGGGGVSDGGSGWRGGGVGAARARQAYPQRRNVWLLISAGVAVILLLSLLGLLSAAALGGFNPFAPSGTATTPGNVGNVGNVGGSHHAATATTTTAPTATVAPTATATVAPTATATTVSASLALNPSTVAMYYANSRDCAGTVTITNSGQQPIGWSWQPATPTLHYLHYQINDGGYQSGNPSDSALNPGQSDVINFQFLCSAGQQYTVPVTDAQQNTYTLTLTPPSGGNGGTPGPG